jgi:hypothetical protein
MELPQEPTLKREDILTVLKQKGLDDPETMALWTRWRDQEEFAADSTSYEENVRVCEGFAELLRDAGLQDTAEYRDVSTYKDRVRPGSQLQ